MQSGVLTLPGLSNVPAVRRDPCSGERRYSTCCAAVKTALFISGPSPDNWSPSAAFVRMTHRRGWFLRRDNEPCPLVMSSHPFPIFPTWTRAARSGCSRGGQRGRNVLLACRDNGAPPYLSPICLCALRQDREGPARHTSRRAGCFTGFYVKTRSS